MRAKRSAHEVGAAHRQGFEPCRIRFGVEAVLQHARCMCGRVIEVRVGSLQEITHYVRPAENVNRRPESNRRSLSQISINSRPAIGRGGVDADALARNQLSWAARRRLFVAMDRTCTDPCPRGTSPTTGTAKEERPPGSGRENRTLTRAVMSRGDAQHGPQ